MQQPKSPYAQLGARLVDNGYAAIPCQPGTKMPGTCTFGEWWPMPAWDKYCDRLPTHHETGIWEKWNGAGLCVALDHTIKVVDIDTDDMALRDAILAAIPQSPVAKRGKKGMSLFYRGSPAIASRSFNVPGHGRVVDLLAHGKQTVIPPTLHPETGKPYAWLDEDETLETTPPESLPLLPDDIVATLEAVLSEFGYQPPVERDPVQGDADTAWREVNNIALSRLDAWVGDLGLPRLKRSGQGYRAVAIFRPSGGGKPTHKRNLHLGLHPDGIVDWGDNDTRYTPISLVMAVSRCSFGEAFDWLRDKLGLATRMLPPENIASIISRGLAKNGVRTMSQEDIERHATEPDAQPASNTKLPDPDIVDAKNGLPDDLTRPPGLVGEITNWVTASSRNPCRTLSLAASLSYVGALAGRRYEGPTGLRTNIYVVGLAPSGFGKEHPRAAIKSLATSSNTLNKFFGGNKISSSSALRNRVKKNPSLIYMIDEFGGFIRKVTSPKSGNHEKEIAEDLLEMTGTAASVFMGADYAQNLAEPIYNPNVCISGTSTADAFWKSMGSGSIADGFLPRFIILDAGTSRPKPTDPEFEVGKPPERLINMVQDVAHPPDDKVRGALNASGDKSFPARKAYWGEGAKAEFDDFVAKMYAKIESTPTEFEPIYARTAENAGRLALIVAVGCDPVNPVITQEVMVWARRVALISSTMLVNQAEDNVSDNDRQAEYKKVRRHIEEARKKGITRNAIARKLNGVVDRRRMGDILDQLHDAEEIVEVVVSPKGGGKKTGTLYLAKYAPKPPQPSEPIGGNDGRKEVENTPESPPTE